MRDPLVLLLMLIGIALYFLSVQSFWLTLHGLDWQSLITVLGLLLMVHALQQTGLAQAVASYGVQKVRDERSWILLICLFTCVLAALLTNDVALLIVLPMLAQVRLGPASDRKMWIGVACAANIGSMITPFGNPQNVILWQTSHWTVSHFVEAMAPLTLTLLVVLLVWLWHRVGKDAVALHLHAEHVRVHTQARELVLMLILFIVLADHQFWRCELGILLLVLVRHARWLKYWKPELAYIFFLMFLDIALLQNIPDIQYWLDHVVWTKQTGLMAGIILSQIISNVPATLMLVHTHIPVPVLMYAVNTGGFGIATGSLANIIMLRWPGRPHGILWRFHMYSFAFLWVSWMVSAIVLARP